MKPLHVLAAIIFLPLVPLLTVAETMSRPLAPQGTLTGRFTQLHQKTTGIDVVYQFPENAPFALMTDAYYGNGVCLGDVDGDDLPDIFLTHYDQGNRLYRNLGDWKFADITKQAGVSGDGAWCAGSSFVDIDNDGDLDLYVCVFDGPNLLYQNDGNGIFTEAAANYGLDYRGPSVMMAFADYDLDGDMDGYLVTHRMPLGEEAKPPRSSKEGLDRGIFRVDRSGAKPKAVLQPDFQDLFAIMDKGEGRIELITAGREDVLYQNDGKRRFVNVSKAAGIGGNDIGLAATWWDADGDGFLDLYVSNDYKGPDHLYMNQADGTFKDVAKTALPHIPWLSMGSDFSDINRDGRMDFMATDMAASTHYQQKVSMGDMEKDQWFLNISNPRQMMRNALYLNVQDSRFIEAAFLTGLASTDWTWSPKFGDLDNDGWEDLFVTNGMSRDFMNSDLARKMPSGWRSEEWGKTPVLRQKNVAFRNTGDLRFEKHGAAWGLDQLAASSGAAYGDLDQDGDLDLVVVNFDDPVSIFRNDINDRNRLVVSLRGGKDVNHFGIGAEVTVETPLGMQVKQLALARGYMSANEPVLHFGLGQETKITRLIVRWSAKQETILKDVNINQHLTVVQDAGLSPPSKEAATETLRYKRVKFATMPAPHRETPFDDYARQPLLPMKHSQLGPGLAVGDANGDGADAFSVGGARGQAGQLVIVSSKMEILTKPFEMHAAREDMGALFFDADGDGDQDLYVVSGGVECAPEDALLGDRLYLNDGKGGFTDATDRLPVRAYSGSGVAAADVDRDGDLDLFVGSRLVPGSYPEAPRSQLLMNEGGKFQDKGELLNTGMVTSGLWTDLNDDGWQDLLVAEDWGPVKCWFNKEGTLEDATASSGLASHSGWWNGLASRDLDGDGDIDFVATNLGLNTKYKASPDHPLHLYYGDLDGTGEKHLVEAGYENDVLYPKRGRSCSSRAMPGLSKRFQSYHDFASATLTEIYGQELERSIEKSVTTLESGAFLNDGQGHFTFKPFPRVAQISQGFGIVMAEVNGDQYPDVYLVHNNYHPQAETGRFDNGASQLLLGQGDGTFTPAWAEALSIPGDAKALVMMDWNRDGSPDWLVTQNDGPMLAFQHPGGMQMVRLKGPNAVGARVTVVSKDGSQQTAEVHAGGGYLSQSTAAVAFGSAGDGISSVRIRWADGKVSQETPDPKAKVWTFVASKA
ncbi:MAG: FG-GAP-like repeat-containing protein [Verrucomicrobiales bacterium]